MMNIKFLFLSLIATAVIFTSCSKDDDDDHHHGGGDFNYHAHIHAPNTDDKHVGDTLMIDVTFEEHSGLTVHHVNIRVINKATGAEIYNAPAKGHVHEESGTYQYTDTFILSNANGVEGHTDWILEAKVWGDGEGVGEVQESVEFHVHP